MRYIYNFFLFLILPFLPLWLLWRSRKNSDYRDRIFERIAFFNLSPTKESIWVHAVSVGEAISSVFLIKELLKRYPKTPIVVTTMTPTGSRRVQEVFKQCEVIHVYAPYDYPFAVKKFLCHFNPKILVLMETELWPNILHYTSELKIPIVLVNARLSAKSFSGYKKISRLMEKVLDCITKVSAQSQIDADRFLRLGLRPEKLLMGGNIKYDIKIPEESFIASKKLRQELGGERHIWVAASTHNGEEEKVLVAAKKVLETFPDTLLILVPRHPERFDQVYDLCCKQGFETVRYSSGQGVSNSTNILLGDVMGKMLSFYGASDLAFVGGSLIEWGGHNMLEPAALGKPVLSGPSLGNFLDVSQKMADANALVIVDNELELAENLIKLFQDKSLKERFGAAALDVIEKHRGATQRILELVAAEIE